ncbi:MAG: helix-turn-helix domain-containing protein [Firmicutes bacterium]|nr:helix-turn-helix domain-containing protein [Bacillota bacterium]
MTDVHLSAPKGIMSDFPQPPVGMTSRGSEEDRESFTAMVSAITAAFGDQTRREIYLYISENEGKTAAEVAEVFGLHPNVARHHLEKLLAGGYLEVSLTHHTPGAGRPAKLYQKSHLMRQSELLPKADTLIITLLKKLIESIPAETLDVIAYQVGWEYGKSLTLNMSAGESMKSLRSAMVTIANALTSLGFSAHTKQESGRTEIIRDVCPFGNLAAGTPALCSIDKAIVEGMLAGLCGPGGQTVIMSSKAKGDLSCSTLACETA